MKLIVALLTVVAVAAQGLLIDPYRFGCTIASTSLLTYWRLDETGDGTVARNDQTVNAIHLNNNDAAIADTTGIIGNGTTHNGASRLSASSPGLDMSSRTFTICGWFKTSNLAANQSLIYYASNQQYMVGYGAVSGQVYFLVRRPDNVPTVLQTTALVSANTWYFIRATYIFNGAAVAGTLELQVNDGTVFTVNTANGSSNVDAADNFTIALGATANSTFYLSGALDEWSIWTRQLTAAEITCMYNSGAGRRP